MPKQPKRRPRVVASPVANRKVGIPLGQTKSVPPPPRPKRPPRPSWYGKSPADMSRIELEQAIRSHPLWRWYCTQNYGHNPAEPNLSGYSTTMLRVGMLEAMRNLAELQRQPDLRSVVGQEYPEMSGDPRKFVMQLSDIEIQYLLQLCRSQPKGDQA